MKNLNAMDIALLLTFATLLIFVSVVLGYNYVDKEVQPELITGFLAIIGAEITACGGIQIFKVKHNKKSIKIINRESENKK